LVLRKPYVAGMVMPSLVGGCLPAARNRFARTTRFAAGVGERAY
jgi:hypothetical protein